MVLPHGTPLRLKAERTYGYEGWCGGGGRMQRVLTAIQGYPAGMPTENLYFSMNSMPTPRWEDLRGEIAPVDSEHDNHNTD